MIKCILLLIILQVISYSQQFENDRSNLNSPHNILQFANHLFCEKDYLRALLEYKRLNSSQLTEKTVFRIGLSESFIGDYQAAAVTFRSLLHSEQVGFDAYGELMKTLLIDGRFDEMSSLTEQDNVTNSRKNYYNPLKLFYTSFLLQDKTMPGREDFLSVFDELEINEVNSLYERKIHPGYKSPVMAGILSAFIPGAGKFYTGEHGDGIMAFIATGVMGYLAYSNFEAGHKTRAWIFSGLAGFFYAGNIYGSVASAQIINAGIRFSFSNDVRFFLNERNYFRPDYNLCEQ